MRVIVFGGTTEGKEAALKLREAGCEVSVSVATELGAEALSQEMKAFTQTASSEYPPFTVFVGRKDRAALTELIKGFDACVDATHPYAEEITENLREVCKTAGIPCYRLLRASVSSCEDTDQAPADAKPGGRGFVVTVDSVEAAVTWLREKSLSGQDDLKGGSGNILLTIGTKALKAFSVLEPERLYARVLPTADSVRAAEEAGLSHRHILALFGPFSEALNTALLKEYRIGYLVTKESGREGGFAEKLRAAENTGCTAIVIKRPAETGMTLEEIMEELLK
ncbi:MAG: precorrin-6A/cobalt-precorrin-6A reductase [Lachnospiraceae bacterium]|nr:precorrin-6A/cobalt-precorrin-6A reductase [Lachnospiraceae bacterium]